MKADFQSMKESAIDDELGVEAKRAKIIGDGMLLLILFILFIIIYYLFRLSWGLFLSHVLFLLLLFTYLIWILILLNIKINIDELLLLLLT